MVQETSGDTIVYGGATFVASLIKENIIDDYYLFVNPVALGKGLSIFDKAEGRLPLTLCSTSFCATRFPATSSTAISNIPSPFSSVVHGSVQSNTS